MEMQLELRQKQELRLTPMLLQAMEILQMNTVDLQGFLSKEMQENPVLEGDLASTGSRDSSDLLRELAWVNSHAQRGGGRVQGDDFPTAAELASAPAWEESLEAHLLLQLDHLLLTERELHCARYLIQCVTPSGYLQEEAAGFAGRFGLSIKEAEALLCRLRQLDPPGICAASLRDCLLAQLKSGTLAYTIVSEHLEALAAGHMGSLAKALGRSVRDVERAAAKIRQLDPCPGNAFSDGGNVAYIVPDILISRDAAGLHVRLNDALLPKLSISDYYAALMKENPEPEVLEYLGARLQRARWILNGVQQRQETLMRCAEAIVDVQRAFFEGQSPSLLPMSMNDIAAQLQVHPSTISRAVRDKYLQCEQGLFPLRSLFVRSLSGGDDASSHAAKKRISALISGEDAAHPLSDQQLCELLEKENIRLSRRTIAKYREELHIPTSSRRKKRG